MPRPRLRRHMCGTPAVKFYKPAGVPLRGMQVEELTHEEWEALRLRYIEKLDQTTSAERMETSQSTLQRILASAHEKVCTAIVTGKAVRVE